MVLNVPGKAGEAHSNITPGDLQSMQHARPLTLGDAQNQTLTPHYFNGLKVCKNLRGLRQYRLATVCVCGGGGESKPTFIPEMSPCMYLRTELPWTAMLFRFHGWSRYSCKLK